MSLPLAPAYINAAGQPIYWIEGANTHTRNASYRPSVLVVHDTDGSDSRDYLRANPRGVSCHYLVGAWPDTQGPRIYKYASEANTVTYTQGPSRLGGIRAPNVNEVAISVEIERASMGEATIAAAAVLCREIIRGWHVQGRQLVMLPHRIIQGDKLDPRLDWRDFCTQVYR